MKKEEYVESVKLNDMVIDIGIDDYGQCYFFEFPKNGKIEEVCCGSYNTGYMYEIADYFGVNVSDLKPIKLKK